MGVALASVHLSWFGKGFEEEWSLLEQSLQNSDLPLVVMGDFNNPTDSKGYNLILRSSLGLRDSHKVAEIVFGDHSIVSDIDGWEGNKDSFKVDHAFMTQEFNISRSEITFDGGDAPVVSDHYGLSVETSWTNLD